MPRPAFTRARISKVASTNRISRTSAASSSRAAGSRRIRTLEERALKAKSDPKVWAFLVDGETDEPESLGAITLPAREKLDNLIFVVNCNLHRRRAPPGRNGQIIPAHAPP